MPSIFLEIGITREAPLHFGNQNRQHTWNAIYKIPDLMNQGAKPSRDGMVALFIFQSDLTVASSAHHAFPPLNLHYSSTHPFANALISVPKAAHLISFTAAAGRRDLLTTLSLSSASFACFHPVGAAPGLRRHDSPRPLSSRMATSPRSITLCVDTY